MNHSSIKQRYQARWLCCLAAAFAFIFTDASVTLLAAEPPIAMVILNPTSSVGQPIAAEYTRVEFDSAYALKVKLTTGKTVAIEKSRIAQLIQYPDANTVLDSPKDRQMLISKREEYLKFASQYPVAKPQLANVVQLIDADIQKLDAGQVRYKGVWQQPVNPKEMTAGDLQINGVIYKGVSVSRLDNDSIIVRHDGGIIRVKLLDASPELLEMIRSHPELLRDKTPIKELKIGDSTLTNAVPLAVVNGHVIVIHQTGVESLPQKLLSEEHTADLLASNKAISAVWNLAETAPAEQLSVPSGELNLQLKEQPTGSPDHQYGWISGQEVEQLWLQTNAEKLIAPPTAYPTRGVNRPSSAAMAESRSMPDSETILKFINSKSLAGEFGFSELNGCMVLREPPSDDPQTAVAFNLRDLNLRVTPQVDSEGYLVVIEGFNGNKVLTNIYRSFSLEDDVILYQMLLPAMNIEVASEDDAIRVARAFRVLILRAGGRESTL